MKSVAAPLLCHVSPHLSRSPCSCTIMATAPTASCSVVALTVDTVQPSMLPTADTESGKSASSEYSVDMEALKVLRKIYYNLRP